MIRSDAIAGMEDALDKYVISGLGNNICFLRSVFRNKRFIELYMTQIDNYVLVYCYIRIVT